MFTAESTVLKSIALVSAVVARFWDRTVAIRSFIAARITAVQTSIYMIGNRSAADDAKLSGYVSRWRGSAAGCPLTPHRAFRLRSATGIQNPA
jgi:hypothetical protein